MAIFQILKTSSAFNWTGKKVLGLHTGNISLAEGRIETDGSRVKSGEALMDMSSITITDIDDPDTRQQFLGHLRNDDFFAVDRFPTARLVLTGSQALSDDQYQLAGNLTIKDITRPVSFAATVEVFNDTLHSMGELKIDRTQYGIKYGSGKFIENLGDKLIHDVFVLQFKIIGQKV